MGHHGPGIAIQRQRRHHPQNRALRVGQLIDQPRQVVFQEALAIGLEEPDRALVIQQIGADQAEIDLLAALIQRHTLQTVGQRAVLHLAERLGIVELELQFAAGGRGVFRQHLAHMIRQRAVRRHRAAEFARIEQPQRDRFLEAGEDLPGARRQRVEVLLRQIDPPVGQALASKHIHANDDGADGKDRDQGAQHTVPHRSNPPCGDRRSPRSQTARSR